MPKPIKINGEEYEEVPALAVKATQLAVEAYTKLGRPTDIFSEKGIKMMDVLISLWEDLYPKDRQEWLEERLLYKNHELTITQQVQQGTGRQLASYPGPLYQMMTLFFPDTRFSDRKTVVNLVKKWPMFQMANKV